MAILVHLKLFVLLSTLAGISYGFYPPQLKDPSYISDSLLRDLFADALSKDTAEDASEEYLDDEVIPLNARLALIARASKAQDERLTDYDSIMERGNPHPSTRDSEYMQHSSLWGHQFISGGAGEGPQVAKPQVKTDATLPAYCNPPNPCPVGYTEEQGCTLEFENTASFSREYQAAQECMCDSEHMFECPSNAAQDQPNGQQNFGFLARQFPQEHKNLVAKKYWVKKVNISQTLTSEKF